MSQVTSEVLAGAIVLTADNIVEVLESAHADLEALYKAILPIAQGSGVAIGDKLGGKLAGMNFYVTATTLGTRWVLPEVYPPAGLDGKELKAYWAEVTERNDAIIAANKKDKATKKPVLCTTHQAKEVYPVRKVDGGYLLEDVLGPRVDHVRDYARTWAGPEVKALNGELDVAKTAMSKATGAKAKVWAEIVKDLESQIEALDA